MADVTTPAPAPGPRKRRHWLRVLVWAIAVVIALVVILYFVVTSPAFLKREVLPRASSLLNANVTVSSASIHPFSEIVLRDLKVQPTNQPAVVTAPEVRVKYSLFDIIGGNIQVQEIALVSPVVQLVQNADGTSNLDPLMEARKRLTQKAPGQPARPSRPAEINIHKLILADGTFRKVQNHAGGTRDLLEVTNLNLTVANVKNGDSGKLQFSAVIRNENNPPAPAMYGLLLATVNGSFDFSLSPDLKPGTVVGDAQMRILQAAGSFSDFGKLDGTLHCDLSPTELKTVSLSFEKEGMRLGELRATGPFDVQKSEGRLRVDLLSVDKRVLNLFAARSGIDFGSTTITCTNEIDVAKSGAVITAAGQLSASKFQLGRTNESTPPLEVRADYNVSVDNTVKTALLQVLNVTGMEDKHPLLRGELTSPMTLAWGNTMNAVGDSSFSLAVTKLNIADWRPFLGSMASAGTLDFDLKVLSRNAGKHLTFDATNRIQNLTTQIGSQHISDATVFLKVRGQLSDFHDFNLAEYDLQLDQSNQTAVAISGSGTYDRANASADLQLALEAMLPRFLRLFNWPDITASSGTAELKARVIQRRQTQTVAGNLNLAKFSGKFGKSEFKNFGTAADVDVEKRSDEIDIHKIAGKLAEGHNDGGEFDLSGTYGLGKKPSQLNLQVSDFNQDSLRPILEPLLGNKKLVSVSVNGTASAQLSPNGSSVVKADVQVSNLVVSDPARQMPETPLEAKLQVDAGLAKQVADLRQLEITLTPTQRAKNELQLQGRVDMSKTNIVSGNLKISADSLDLTSYYDLFAATNKTIAKESGRNKAQNAGAPPSSQAIQGLTTNALPFRNFTLDASVRAFYLGEIAATNFQAHIKLDGSHILLKPFQLAVDGAPMFATADADMSVPGYKYVLTFSTTNVPFAPLWNTFKPGEKGKVGGTLTAYANISGTGTSGESLQETLTGNFHVGTTNLNLQVTRLQSGMLKLLVEVVAKVPQLFENPESTVAGIGSSVVGNIFGGSHGGLEGNLAQSPIDVITATGKAGNGHITLQQAVVRSSVFKATVTNGDITLAPVLTNSAINIPISIYIARSIAQTNSSIASVAHETNMEYVKLPDFFSEVGTIGHPRPGIDKVAIGKQVIQKIIPGLGGTNGILSNPLQGLGGLLHGETNTNLPMTNSLLTTNSSPATNNQAPVNKVLNRFMGK